MIRRRSHRPPVLGPLARHGISATHWEAFSAQAPGATVHRHVSTTARVLVASPLSPTARPERGSLLSRLLTRTVGSSRPLEVNGSRSRGAVKKVAGEESTTNTGLSGSAYPPFSSSATCSTRNIDRYVATTRAHHGNAPLTTTALGSTPGVQETESGDVHGPGAPSQNFTQRVCAPHEHEGTHEKPLELSPGQRWRTEARMGSPLHASANVPLATEKMAADAPGRLGKRRAAPYADEEAVEAAAVVVRRDEQVTVATATGNSEVVDWDFAQNVNEVEAFIAEQKRQVAMKQLLDNQSSIPTPTHPDDLVPEFRRIKRHQEQVIVTSDPDYPVFDRRDVFIELPPPPRHPWVKNTPIGSFITHGDGQLNVVGTGEVGFEDADAVTARVPSGVEPESLATADAKPQSEWRGYKHISTIGKLLPQHNGKVLQDCVVKHSFALTGRGVFALRKIRRGEHVMIVQSTAQNVGIMSEIDRLVEMSSQILLHVHKSLSDRGTTVPVEATASASLGREISHHGALKKSSDELEYLHDWILTGQCSSLAEHWPVAAMQRVIHNIGGPEVLAQLELHPLHINRIAAIIDLNSFLVESSYAERKGMAYFPEAGFLNHSCVPNATYEIMPEHAFRESEYFIDEWDKAHDDDTRLETPPLSQAQDDGGQTPCKSDLPGSATQMTTTGPTEHFAAITDAVDPVRERSVLHLGHGGTEAGVLLGHENYPNLTVSGAPAYLFCCRAEKDIEPGEEILISYVPPNWSFDNRQYVLHDRYRFWCKCPKCAPVLDSKYSRVPKLVMFLVIVSITLQLLVAYLRRQAIKEEEEREYQMEYESRHQGGSLETSSDGSGPGTHVPQRQRGLIEIAHEDRLRKAYELESVMATSRIVDLMKNDHWAQPPR